MATLREWLQEAGFPFGEPGTWILHQEADSYPGWNNDGQIREITHEDKVLDEVFECGFGGPQAPRIAAGDGKFIYHPAQYDGSTWLEKTPVTPAGILEAGATPYPGG